MTTPIRDHVPVSSVVELLHRRAADTPDALAYSFMTAGVETDSLTSRELAYRAKAIAARLQQLTSAGERALLLFPAGIEYICAFYGCLTAGVVAIPAYPPRMNRNLDRLELILKDAQPSAVLTNAAVFRQMRTRFTDSPHLTKLNWIVTDDIAPDEAGSWIDPQPNRDNVAFLQYTSASTSKPKGVIVSHGNILHNQMIMNTAARGIPRTIAVSWLPLFHDMGLISVVLAGLYNGMRCHLMSPADFLKTPRLWLEAITRYRGTFSGAPDFAYQLCVDRISVEQREGLDLSSWTIAYNGSEPIRSSTFERFTKAFAPCGFKPEAFFPCYGLAEHTLFATGGFYKGSVAFSRRSLETHRPHRANGDEAAHLVSCGSPLFDTTVRIVDAKSLQPCAAGQIGEIWLASQSTAQGYWNNEEACWRDFQARLEGEPGNFLRTGDLGFLHEGELFVTGRIKDLVIIRGRNLVPQDIEQTVERSDTAVQPSFAAAVSVEAGGAERLVVVAEVRREVWRKVNTKALIDRIRSAVANEFGVAVSAVAVLRPGTLPKTSSGKTQRAKVRKDFLAGNLTAIAEWRDEAIFSQSQTQSHVAKGWSTPAIEKWIVASLATHLKMSAHQIENDRPVSSFGLDSLVAATFASEIEETFGIECDIDQLFMDEPTVKQLAQRLWRETLSHQPSASPARRNGDFAASTSMPPVQNYLEFQLPKPNGSNGKPQQHPFNSHVNPQLARLLSHMAMDKTFIQGEGSWLWDDKGHRYLDFLAQYGALPFGSNPARIWSALTAVRDSGEPSFVQPSYLNAAGELAKRLIAVAPPGMAYVTFSNSGAEAVEAAIKLCRSTTNRNRILAASNGFHGKTLGALSATDKEKYQKPFGAPVPGFDYVPYGDIEALREALAARRYAGFIVEPVQAEGGIIEPPAGYLRLARKACRDSGTLFIADEIQTGMGRTGAMFVCCELGITPDVLLVAKALGGGLIPIGACISTAAVYNAEFALKHTSTFAGNTLACRAGLATLDLLSENNRALLKQVASIGSRLKEGLLDLKRRFPDLIGDVRGRGFLLGLRFGLNRNLPDYGLLGYLGELEEFTFLTVGYLLNFEGVRVGCTLNQGGVIRIEPPLTATWQECEYFLRALKRVLLLLEQRDVASLTAQISGLKLPLERPHRNVDRPRAGRSRSLEIQPGDGRFAFLVHPLALNDYPKLDPSLSILSEEQLATLSLRLADTFNPFVIGETHIVGRNGKAAYGEFILIPRRADELKSMPRQEAIREIREGVLVAQKRGAKIVGLGAYTSVVTDGGLSLRGTTSDLPALTTGNSYTAVAARETVRLAATERGWILPLRTVAVVGAGGAIGRALSILLAGEVGRLILVGNPDHPEESRRALLRVAGQIVSSTNESNDRARAQGSVASWIAERSFGTSAKPDRAALTRLGEDLVRCTSVVVISTEVEAVLPQADIVVCCTSSTEPFVHGDNLRSDAIVCDISRPSNVSPDLVMRKPGVMVLNGGVIRLPENSHLGFDNFLPRGHAYACMAETMMLAMDHRYRDASLGFDLSLAQMLDLEQLARELDFQVVLVKQGPEVEHDTPILSVETSLTPAAFQTQTVVSDKLAVSSH